MTACHCRVLAALSMIVAVGGAGQPPQGQKDPQATYEPRSNPGAGQKFLAQFVGDWEVDKAFFPRAGEPVRMKGTCRQTMIHDGRFLKSEFVFRSNGVESTGLGIIGFETQTGAFTSVWTDSRATRMSLRQSEGPFNGQEIVLLSRSLKDNEKGPPRSKTVTRLEENGRKIIHRQYALGADGKDRLMMELVMKRKPETAPAGR